MAVNDRKLLRDGYLSIEGAVDTGLPPSLIDSNRVAWAVNTQFRDGWPQARPGLINRQMSFDQEYVRAGLEEGYYQGSGTFISDDGQAFIAVSVSGRIFTINITGGYAVREITIEDDPNTYSAPHAWFEQAERFLVVQNMVNSAILYDGSTARRSGNREVPVGGPMAYGKGRLWVARGSQYFGGDLVYSDPVYGRDSVIRFTENEFLNEGGAFAVPSGPIKGMAFAANLDTSLGDGDLAVGTLQNIHAFDAPIDRDVWKNLEQPLQRYAARNFGPTSHEGMVLVNGDIIYRAPDGIRSLMYARRDFQQWGQTPISREVQRALQYDTQQWLSEVSAVNFDNRMLMTAQPHKDNYRGVWFNSLVSLDYHKVTGMGSKRPPQWEGIWTGLRVFRIITIEVQGVLRCFILALSNNRLLQLWELSRGLLFDRDEDDDVPIEWTVETRGWTFQKPTEWKRLMGAIQWYDQLVGEASASIYYRADESQCWHGWANWSDCVKYRNCEATAVCESYPYTEIQPIENLRSQQRPYIGLPQPPDVADPQYGGLTRDGFEFQVRFEFSGRFRMKRLMLLADEQANPPWGDLRNISCPTTETGSCSTDECKSLICCPPDDFTYRINAEDDELPILPGDPDYPAIPGTPEEGYPIYPGGPPYVPPEYPDPPPDDPWAPPETPLDPEEPDVPTFDPEVPDEPPPIECVGTTVVVESFYVWGLLPDQDPNTLLSEGQIACHVALHAIEVQDFVTYYESLGYTVSIVVDSMSWVWRGYLGHQLSMLQKSTCNPNDGITDKYVYFNGFMTLATSVCVIPP